MNIDFKWNICQVVESIPRGTLSERAKRSFLYPHDDIWPTSDESFMSLANRIFAHLNKSEQYLFLSVCLASFLLNPVKAPQIFIKWFDGKKSSTDCLELGMPENYLSSWRWGRAAIPLADPVEGWRDRIVYAVVGYTKAKTGMLFPKWISQCLNRQAQESIAISASLVSNNRPESRY